MPQLLTEIQSEEEREILARIYRKYKNLMLKIARDILHDPAAAEDVVQEVFIKLIRLFGTLDLENEKRQKSYLIVLTRNTAIDFLRKRNREKLELTEDYNSLEHAPVCGQTEQTGEEGLLRERLYDAVLQLPDIYRDVFTLKYRLGHSDREIAGILNITTDTVRKRISRGKKRLERILSKGGEEE